jgi:putative hydrolase of the HAD superfamily
MLRPDIKAVFLDAGNTLFTEHSSRPEIYREAVLAHGVETIDLDTVAAAMQHAFADLPSTVDGNFRYSSAWFQAFNHRILAECGVAEDQLEKAHRSLREHFEDPASYRLFDEVREVLELLAEQGMQVGIVSNWSDHLPDLLDGLGLGGLVSFIITSADLKAEKPGRAIFERALFRAGVAASETVHAGDHYERDVEGALNAGLRAVWVNRAPTQDSEREGVPVVQDLRGLVQLLEAQPNPARN